MDAKDRNRAMEVYRGAMGYAVTASRERPAERCLLPGCSETTSHRGGYCCADHCRKHREMARAGR